MIGILWETLIRTGHPKICAMFLVSKLLLLELEFFVDQTLKTKARKETIRVKEVGQTRKFFWQLTVTDRRAKVKYVLCEKTCWNAVGGFLCNLCDCFCWQGRREVLQSNQGGEGQKSYVLQNWQNCSRTIAVTPVKGIIELLWTIIVNVHTKSMVHQKKVISLILWRVFAKQQSVPAISGSCLVLSTHARNVTLEQGCTMISYHNFWHICLLSFNTSFQYSAHKTAFCAPVGNLFTGQSEISILFWQL